VTPVREAAPAPVAACSDWDSLFGALQAQVAHAAALAVAPRRLAQAVMVAPVAIARWIAERAPALARTPRPLTILVVGAEKLDAVDQGRWYQLLPALLGARIDVRVTLVGDCLDEGVRSPLHAAAPHTPARLHTGTLADFLATAALQGIDLVFLFHPGFQKHRGWLTDSSLARLVAAGVPTVAAAYGLDESEVDRWVAECYGYATQRAPVVNPFYLDLSDAHSQVHWARALWQFQAQAPRPDFRPDQVRLDQLERLSRMVMHSMASGKSPLAPHGARVALKASNGAARTLTYLFDEYFCDLAQGEVLALRAGALEALMTLPDSAIASYPPPQAGDLERALWAASIKARHLMSFYAAPVDEKAGHAQARAMYAELTHKVDALLKG
jgi:hypothetical protein